MKSFHFEDVDSYRYNVTHKQIFKQDITCILLI